MLGLFRLCCQCSCAFLQCSEHMSAATVFFGLLAPLVWIVTSLYLVAPLRRERETKKAKQSAVDVLPFLCRVSLLCFGLCLQFAQFAGLGVVILNLAQLIYSAHDLPLRLSDLFLARKNSALKPVAVAGGTALFLSADRPDTIPCMRMYAIKTVMQHVSKLDVLVLCGFIFCKTRRVDSSGRRS